MKQTAKPPALVDPDEIRGALSLIIPAGAVTELRILEATTAQERYAATHAGYFDDHEKLIAAAQTVSSAKGFYIVPNAVAPELLARAVNRIRRQPKGESTTDLNIAARRWLLIDIDPGLPAGISANDEEHEAAIATAREIRDHLRAAGWPEGILADSGNGAHVLQRIDLPADDGDLIKRCLAALKVRFPKVDDKVFNPARIWKLYGTRSCKGDDTPDRPHRISRIIEAPEHVQVVDRSLLEAPAAQAPKAEPRQSNQYNGSAAPFDLPAFIARHNLDVTGPDSWTGRQGAGQRWTLNTSPMCDHHDGAAFLLQHGTGAITAQCHHQSCSWTWTDLRTRLEPKQPRATNGDHRNGKHDRVHGNQEHDPEDFNRAFAEAAYADDEPPFTPSQREPGDESETERFKDSKPEDKPLIYSAGELITAFPKQREIVIGHLLRRGEVMNIISASKVGKSWLVYSLALCIVMGWSWLARYFCSAGRVLLVDNELHPEVLAHRLQVVAGAMGINYEEYRDRITIMPLRGRLKDFTGIDEELRQFEPGTFNAVILDAFYRALPIGHSENDNAMVAGLYNHLDLIARRLDACWVNIHHASKGSQADKSVIDVGAGAGAQSRAADSHLVLRAHDEPDAVVLEAVVRSFPPVEPVGLRWEFPLWIADAGLDPAMVKGRLAKAEERKLDRDKEASDKLLSALLKGPQSVRQLRAHIGAGRERCNRLLDALEAADAVEWEETAGNGGKQRVYKLKQVSE